MLDESKVNLMLFICLIALGIAFLFCAFGEFYTAYKAEKSKNQPIEKNEGYSFIEKGDTIVYCGEKFIKVKSKD